MTTPELPPLPSLPSRSFADHERYIIQLRDVMRARECILLARIAELEADAARYRWLRDNAAYSLSLTKDDHKICYETATLEERGQLKWIKLSRRIIEDLREHRAVAHA